MLTGVDYIRNICKCANIPITSLEKECGFSNGYLNKKLKKIPYVRALAVADFFKRNHTEVNLEQILGAAVPSIKPSASSAKNECSLIKHDEHDIEKILESTIQMLTNQEGLTIDDNPVSSETIESVIFAVRLITEMAKEKTRKDKKD